MIHGLSPYNYDFAVAAIPIQLMLMIFYLARRNLPVRRNRLFLVVMVSNLTMTVFDLVSCEMNEVWRDFPLSVMYIVNLLYFAPFIIRGWALLRYTYEVCLTPRLFFRRRRLSMVINAIFTLPTAVTLALIMLSPFTGAIFTFGPDGYVNNPDIYPIIYFTTYFNISASLLITLVRCRAVPGKIFISTLAFNLILLIGIVFRKLFYHVLVTSYVSIVTILVIYLSSQNPDFYRDRVTLLFNRDAFELIALDFLQEKKRFYCVLITAHNYEMAGIDFKYHQLNNSLRLVGSWLQKHYPDCYVFYFDNGNYLLLHEGEMGDQRESVISELESRFAHPWKDERTEVSLSLSTLVLPYEVIPGDVAGIHSLLRYAFGHIYAENQRGNHLITAKMLAALRRQNEVEQALDRALNEKRLVAHYQPIFSTDENRIVGAEALARLTDPVLGAIPPDEFIYVAERTGEINELGRQIFEHVCKFIRDAKLRERGIEFINVNLSPAQCMNAQLTAEFTAIAAKYGVPMEMIDFEVTESAAEDAEEVQDQLVRLQKCGADLSIDDFGTGTSNLTRLMKLPIHVVKLDMNVVWAHFSGETTVLPDLVRMFKNAGLKVVVEGVETEAMKKDLTELDCDYLQGYYFSRPIPPEDFEAKFV